MEVADLSKTQASTGTTLLLRNGLQQSKMSQPVPPCATDSAQTTPVNHTPLALIGSAVIFICLDVCVRSQKKNVCLPDIIYDRVLEPWNSEVKSLCKHLLLYTSNTTKYNCTVSTFNCKWYLGINPLHSAVTLCDTQREKKGRCGKLSNTNDFLV
jgi:hypothetical protein